MTSKGRGGAHPSGQGGGHPRAPGPQGSRNHPPAKRSGFAKFWKAASANPLVVALVSVVVGALAAIPATISVDDHLHQGAANNATVQAEQDQAAAALSHDASEVILGQGLRSPQLVIENTSDGWIRNITLLVPVPVQETREPGGGVSVSIPNFSIYSPVFGGFTGVWFSGNSAYFHEPLPDIGPCELVATTALKSFPADLDSTALAKAEIDFTDPNGIAWTRSISGPPVRNTGYKGSGAVTWAPYPIVERVPGCTT